MKNISRNIAIAVSILIVSAIFYFFSNIVAYVLIAWVLSLIGQPLMRFFQQKIQIGRFKAGPSFSAILTIISFFVVFATLIWLFVPLVVEQARNLAEVDYNAIGQALNEPLTHLNDQLHRFGLVETDESATEQLNKALRNWFKPTQIGNFFSLLIGVFGNFLITLFSIIFITYFFLKEQSIFSNFITALAPQQYEDETRKAISSITTLLTRYFGGILIQITIITLFVSVLLGLLGIKNALLIGFFAALINVIPYLGPLIGATFGVFITISSNLGLAFYSEMLPLLGKVVGVFAAMQLLDNIVLQPYIFSKSIKAHPLEIFIVILLGAQINGIVGMVLAIPVYTAIRVIAKEFLSEFKIVQQFTRRMEDEN
jgi:predicted PurR-regulated permease PerM